MALMQSQGGGRGKKMLWVKRVVLLLVLLYLIQIFFFFLKPEEHPVKPLNTRLSAATPRQQRGKPWPQLSSLTSWTVNPDLSADSCEAFFGNGFTQAFTLLDPGPQIRARGGSDTAVRSRRMQQVGGSWRQVKDAVDEQEAQVRKRNKVYQPPPRGSLFQCFYSERLRTSICEGTNMVMYPKRIKMSKGGEPLESVIGRNEEEELPYFTPGAFEVMVPETEERRALFNKTMLDRLIPVEQIAQHTMHHLFEQVRTVPVDEVVCAERVSTPTIIVTRFEYANLFHTVTDWYNAYITSRITNLKRRPRLIFVDGHCKSPMDDAWKAMFSGVHFARHLTGPVCFDHLIFSPLGYNSPFFKALDLDLTCRGCAPEDISSNPRHLTARVREFGEFLSAAFNMTPEIMPPKGDSILKVLFVRREDYLAHPRHSGKPESRLSNEIEVLEALRSWASSRSGYEKVSITVVEGLFAHLTFTEQLKEIRESSIIVGAHGAGLSHLLFSRPQKTAILELMSPYYMRPHFQFMSQWMGIEYHKIEMTSSEVDCSEVTRRIDQIFLGMLRKEGGIL